MTDIKRHICLFGLSGNPPTGLLGHQGFVKLLVDSQKFDEIWVLPVFKHMFSSKRNLAKFDDRMAMCALAFEKLSGYPHTRVCVKQMERTVCLERLKADPTLTTGTSDILDSLTTSFPGFSFSLAMGEDTYRDLVRGKWKRSKDIAAMIQNRFEVLARPAVAAARQQDPPEPPLEALVEAQNLEASKLQAEGKAATAFGAVVHSLPGTPGDGREFVSSTTVRTQLSELPPYDPDAAEGKDLSCDEESPLRARALVDPQVLGYCRTNRLFGAGWDPEMSAAEDAAQAAQALAEATDGEFTIGWMKWLIIGPLVLVFATIAVGLTTSPSGAFRLPAFMGGSGGAAPLLTEANFDELTEGKVVFVKMFAPWCGHCKRLKPTWDALASSVNVHADNEDDAGLGHVLVADIDCTSKGGKPLCDDYGVEGFPTLLTSDDDGDFVPYEGARSMTALKDHVMTLRPLCSPESPLGCSPEQAQKLQGFQALEDRGELTSLIQEHEREVQRAEDRMAAQVSKLREKHRALKHALEQTKAKVDIATAKAVAASANRATRESA